MIGENQIPPQTVVDGDETTVLGFEHRRELQRRERKRERECECVRVTQIQCDISRHA